MLESLEIFIKYKIKPQLSMGLEIMIVILGHLKESIRGIPGALVMCFSLIEVLLKDACSVCKNSLGVLLGYLQCFV